MYNSLRTDVHSSYMLSQDEHSYGVHLSTEMKTAQISRGTLVVDLRKVRWYSRICRRLEIWSMRPRRLGNLTSCPRVCSSHSLYNLADSRRLDTIGITQSLLWVAQSLREPFLRMGTTDNSCLPTNKVLSRNTRPSKTKLEVP